VVSLFHQDDVSSSGTLMSRMAQNQKIEYGSDIFNKGIEQFKGNISDVISMAKEQNIPIIISTLASNLKDQKPFIYDQANDSKNANLVFNKAKKEYDNSNFEKADSLFRIAKDLDQLRFRAPEKINLVIKEFGKNFKVPIVDSDSLLSQICDNRIIGDQVMTDHLHLTLDGYHELGKFFYDKMNQLNLLPNEKPKYVFELQDSMTKENFLFSNLDSTIAAFKLKILKNDWPFKNKNKLSFNSLIKQNNFVDSLAAKSVNNELDWHKAHLNLANYYIKKKILSKFIEEIKILIFQYPIITEYYEMLITELISHQMYDEAYEYLMKNYNISKNHFSTKWLGIVELSRRDFTKSIQFLEESFNYDKNDAQVYYNLAGAYSQIRNYKTALDYINKCLNINSNYAGAANLKSQLENILLNQNKVK
ncbi:MAG: hypothetical protein KDC88_02575, partial [Ignavibacteriae bacterium]|nr:hypothetical protein [Ignavibacteriota bacterium]